MFRSSLLVEDFANTAGLGIILADVILLLPPTPIQVWTRHLEDRTASDGPGNAAASRWETG
jgi:hypothetical protein